MQEMILSVALLQLSAVANDTDAALIKGETFCRAAAAQGADIALFPEMWSIGYAFPEDSDAALSAWRARAITTEDGPFLRYRELARELEMAIAVTYLEATEGAPRNAVSLIDRHGKVALSYAKVHTCDFGDEALLAPGDAFRVATLDTAKGPVKVGAMICYDREFPESARVLMLGGAEIVLVPNACPWDHNRSRQLYTRAYENMIGIAMANYAAPDQDGHSMALDGMAYEVARAGDDGGPREMTLVEAGEAEGVYLAHFDLAALRAYRGRETWGDAFRKPWAYGAITETRVAPPFRRSESRREGGATS